MDKKKKNILIISIISIILISTLVIIGSTTSFFGWRAEKEATVDVIIASGEGVCALKSDNNKFIEPSLTKYSGRIIKLKAIQNMGGKASITWNMNINSIAGLQDESFKYEMINSSTGISYGSGNFKNAVSGSTITFSTTEEVLGYGLEYEFTLYLWIDGTFGNYQTLMADKTLDFDISCNLVSTETGTVYEPQIPEDGTAAQYITNLYTSSPKTLITQENTGNQYNYATSVNLMNDGLGSEGNIRYYGNSPSNYIYFNCSDYNNQTEETCEKWRIVGVFDGKVKIIREESIGTYSWDYNIQEGVEANWHDATVMTLLNNGYYNNDNNVKFYNNTDLITINFQASGIGFKNDDTRSMVSEATWYLGAWDNDDIYPDTVYGYEHGYEKCLTCTGETEWTGKIALPYASDYGFAADLRYCAVSMNNYNTSACTSNNWLYQDDYMYFINTYQSFPNYVWIKEPIGNIKTDTDCSVPYPIYPTLYLNEDVVLKTEGTGTSFQPYQISVPKQIEYVDFTLSHSNYHMIGYTEEKTELNIPSTFQAEDGTWYKITAIEDDTFNGLTNLTNITIPNSVTSIGTSAFAYSGITSITIPGSVTKISIFAFDGCSNLTTVAILNGVHTIEMNAFSNCSSLTNIILPDSIEIIDMNAFSNCSSLETINIPRGLTEITDNVFSGCSSLTSIIIPNNIKYISRFAFGARLTDIYYEGNEQEWENILDSLLYEDPASMNSSLITATKHYNHVIS